MTINPVGTIYDSTIPTVIVHNGLRGAQGLVGDKGDGGDPGDSINVTGQWQSGATYGPLDAVTWRSSGSEGVQSLFVQISSVPASVSTTEPQDEPARWSEIGLTEVNGALGSVWRVVQPGHGFLSTGTPVAYTAGSGYVPASASNPATVPIALVREVVDANEFILQSSGGMPLADDVVSDTGSFVDGAFYYVSAVAGLLTQTAPTGAGQIAVKIYQHGLNEGIALPWTPADATPTPTAFVGTITKYYYTAIGSQTAFTGPDDNTQTPDYTNAVSVECFQNGLNLREADEYSTNGSDTLTLVTPAALDDSIEIWVTERAVNATKAKLDPLLFDGVTTTFALTISAVNAPFVSAAQYQVFVDGSAQEPEVDFTIIDDAGTTRIVYTVAPEAISSGWIIVDIS